MTNMADRHDTAGWDKFGLGYQGTGLRETSRNRTSGSKGAKVSE